MLKIVILAALVACSTAATICGSAPCQTSCTFTNGSSGKPDCAKTGDGDFRNNNDPTKYWKCTGGVLTSVSCSTDFLFDEATKACVCRNEWTWTAPCDPIALLPDDTTCPNAQCAKSS